jgi:hypothetical protein
MLSNDFNGRLMLCLSNLNDFLVSCVAFNDAALSTDFISSDIWG